MAEQSVASDMAWIEAALARLEAWAAQAPHCDSELARRHLALRAAVGGALRDIELLMDAAR